MRSSGDRRHEYWVNTGSLDVTNYSKVTHRPQRTYGLLRVHVSAFGIDFTIMIDRRSETVCRGRLDKAIARSQVEVK